jgi:hypothetical protein
VNFASYRYFRSHGNRPIAAFMLSCHPGMFFAGVAAVGTIVVALL